MNRTTSVVFFALLLVASSAFASRLDTDNSEYGLVSVGSSFQTCLANGGTLSSDYTGALTPSCLEAFTAETFISPSILSNTGKSVAVFDFKLNDNVIGDSTLTLTGSRAFYFDTGSGYGSFFCGSNAAVTAVQCFDDSVAADLTALHAVGFSDTDTIITTFTIPGGTGKGFVFFAAIDVTDPVTNEDPPADVTATLASKTSEVPEPATLPVLGAGLAGVILLGRRRLAKLL